MPTRFNLRNQSGVYTSRDDDSFRGPTTPRSITNLSQLDTSRELYEEVTARERWVFFIDIEEVLVSDKNLYFIKKVSVSHV